MELRSVIHGAPSPVATEAHPLCPWPRFLQSSLSASLAVPQQQHRLHPLNSFKFRRRTRYGNSDVAVKDPRCTVYYESSKVPSGFELRRKEARYATPRATALSTHELSRKETDEVFKRKEFLIAVLRNLECGVQWVRAASVIGTLALGVVLVWRSLANFAIYSCCGVAAWMVGISDHGSLKSFYVKAVEQLKNFLKANFTVAYNLQTIFSSVVAQRLARKAKGKNGTIRSAAGDLTISTAPRLRAPFKSEYGDLIGACISNVAMVMMNITDCVGYLRSRISSEAVIADNKYLDKVMARVEAIRRDLQFVEVALFAKESLLRHSEPNHMMTGLEKFAKAPIRRTSRLSNMKFGDSDIVGGLTASSWVEYITPVAVESKTLPVFGHSKPAELQEKSQLVSLQGDEAPGYFPLKLQIESLPHDATAMILGTSPRGKSPSSADDDIIEVRKPCESSFVEEQNAHPPFNQLTKGNLNQEPMTQRVRSSLSDPWWNGSAHPGELGVLGGDDWAVPSIEQLRNRDSQSVDIVSVVGLKTNATRRDGMSNRRAVFGYNGAEFWGRYAGRKPKTEQRGSLIRRKATRRGNLGSEDYLEDNRSRGRGREEEQNQFLGRDRPSIAGQSWDGQQPGASGREVEGDYREPLDGSLPEEADVRPQDRQYVRDLDRRENGSYGERGLEYSGSLRSNFGPGERSSSDDLSRGSREWGVTTQPTDAASFSRQSKDVNEEFSRPNRTWDVPSNSEGSSDRVAEVGPQIRRNLDSSAASQLEINNRNVTVQQTKQAQSQKFDRYLDEGQALLEQGMQGLDGNIEVGVAERMLYEGAKLFGRAAEMDPENLTAVGLLGNTLLVHGQLKLKLSQRLRSMLSPPQMYSPSAGGMRDNERRSLELTLQDVCEECEDLLMDAGRKYRRALFLDKNDVRALYNWGLALCYRGQLISEEDGERAMQDADKVYLAAIDKFEAMLGISKRYSAPALLNWGLAMRDRSRLRAMGDKERVRLLLQAKELFMDALRFNPNYGQARGAVAACAAEVAALEEFGSQLSGKDRKERPNRNWWQKSA